MNLTSWLEKETCYPKIFWKTRDSKKAFASIGNTHKKTAAPYFIAAPFSPKQPSITIFPKKIREGELLSAQKQHLSYTVKESCSQKEWADKHAFIIDQIENGSLQKLVLGRSKTLSFTKTLNPWPLMAKLSNQARNATLFCVQLEPKITFFGASPEMLYTRQKNIIHTEALAGTRPLGTDEEEFLSDPKERREFSFVRDFLKQALLKISNNQKWEVQDRVIHTPTTSHLYNSVKAELNENISDEMIIKILHPTPAMGGVPRNLSLQLLEQLEPFQRGHFAAPLGWISKEKTEIAVGIRSALITDKQMEIYAAAGIVQGSQAIKEWNEIEHKMALIQGVL